MVNGIRTIYPSGLDKSASLLFFVDTRVWYETSEESQRTYRLKRCVYKNEDEINSPNILSDKCSIFIPEILTENVI